MSESGRTPSWTCAYCERTFSSGVDYLMHMDDCPDGLTTPAREQSAG